jgi:hypothetical protein
VGADGHHLAFADGTPFFWLGDTAWELFARLDRAEAAVYLDDRARKGFTVVQAVAVPELGGSGAANAYGRAPFVGGDPGRPDAAGGMAPGDPAGYGYWGHVDHVLGLAAERGLYVALLPTWGSHVADAGAIFDAAKARAYGRFLGERYRERPNLVWVLGGDRKAVVGGQDHRPVWRAMAEGIRAGLGRAPLMTYHPSGTNSSAEWFHGEEWLSFNMVQSSHNRPDDPFAWEAVGRDFGRSPAKPVLDAEPNYEDHPVAWKADNGYFRDHDVRKQAYRSVLAGGCGVTYGHHSVWQFFAPGRTPVSAPDRTWREALGRPGAAQMGHLRRLVESRPAAGRVPDQDLLADPGDGAAHARAALGPGGAYAFAYLPAARPLAVRLDRLTGDAVAAWWFDPRTGAASPAGTVPRRGTHTFTPPAGGPDWVLVLDDQARSFPPPGAP